MMATYSELMEAARNADAAGEEADARQLVAAAQRARDAERGEVLGTFADGKGKIYRRPDGSMMAVSPVVSTTNQETIDALMRGDTYQSAVQSQSDKQRLEGNWLARLNEFNRGIPFVGSYLDEAMSIVNPSAAKEMRLDTAAMQREAPGQTATLNVGGGLLSAIVAAPSVASNIPQAVSNLPRWGKALLGAGTGAAAGATEGAIYEFGEGQGAADRLQRAERGAEVGGALGGAFGLVAPFAADLVDRGLRALKNSDASQISSRFGISRDAAAVVKQHLDADDLNAARQTLMRAGDDAMLGEATPGARSLLDAASARGGQAQNVVSEAIEGRVAAGNTRLRQASDDILGPAPIGVRSAAEEISRRTAPQRKAAYTAAYSTPIDYSTGSKPGARILEVLDALPVRIRKQVAQRMDDMNNLSRLRGEPVFDAPLLNEAGERIGSMPTVAQLDFAKRALDDLARDNVDTFGRATSDGRIYEGFAAQVREAVKDATGGPDGTYARALSVGGDKVAEDQALRLGSDILQKRVTREDVIRQMSGASQDARNAAKVGLRQEIDEIMANARGLASRSNVEAQQVYEVLKPLTTEAARDKIRVVLGPDEANRFFKTADELMSGFELRAAVSENSRTARRQAVNETLDAATAPGAVRQAAAGDLPSATKSVVQLLTGETPEALAFRREGVAEEIARFLTTQRGKSAEAALRYVNQAMAGQKLTNAQAQFVARTLTGAGYSVAVPQANRSLQPQ